MKKTIFSQYGRSMVEMLGVLAIIGVLSVGSISGYSKAMMKYKMNKTIDIANQLLATAFTKFANDSSSLSVGLDGTSRLTEIMVKAGWVPDGLKPMQNVTGELTDPFGNGVWIFKKQNRSIGIGWAFPKTQPELCYTFLDLSKGWADSLNYVQIDHSATADGSVQQKTYGFFYGNKACQSGVKCLADLNITDIQNVCNQCERQSCRFYFISNAM